MAHDRRSGGLAPFTPAAKGQRPGQDIRREKACEFLGGLLVLLAQFDHDAPSPRRSGFEDPACGEPQAGHRSLRNLRLCRFCLPLFLVEFGFVARGVHQGSIDHNVVIFLRENDVVTSSAYRHLWHTFSFSGWSCPRPRGRGSFLFSRHAAMKPPLSKPSLSCATSLSMNVSASSFGPFSRCSGKIRVVTFRMPPSGPSASLSAVIRPMGMPPCVMERFSSCSRSSCFAEIMMLVFSKPTARTQVKCRAASVSSSSMKALGDFLSPNKSGCISLSTLRPFSASSRRNLTPCAHVRAPGPGLGYSSSGSSSRNTSSACGSIGSLTELRKPSTFSRG